MNKEAKLTKASSPQTSPDTNGASDLILHAMPHPVLHLSATGRITYVNSAAEDFLALSAPVLCRMAIDQLLPEGNPLRSLVNHVLTTEISVNEYGLELSTPRTRPQLVDIQVVPGGDTSVIVVIQKRAIAQQIDQQLTHRGAARSVTGVAAMLAHEIKNPLAGIKGAAQLLEAGASPQDVELTKLICTETDRIANLVDRMEVFTDHRPTPRTLVNIHEVLSHVRRLAQTGWGQGVRFQEDYDPSLPPVSGDRDQLIQVFLNLVKNAVEAVPDGQEASVTLTTAYRPGVRMQIPGLQERVDLPLEVSVSDNGPGIREDIKSHLFDPFVSTKTNGNGLGLALVAKIVGDHGGIIEFNSHMGQTSFKTRLPILKNASHAGEDHA